MMRKSEEKALMEAIAYLYYLYGIGPDGTGEARDMALLRLFQASRKVWPREMEEAFLRGLREEQERQA